MPNDNRNPARACADFVFLAATVVNFVGHIGSFDTSSYSWERPTLEVGLPKLQFTFPVWITLLALAIAGLLILAY
jgi:hypothetical protein